MLELGSKAPIFNLFNTSNQKTESISQYQGKKGLLVAFICNHCPYVIHIIDHLSHFANNLEEQGIGVVFISSNNIETHPQDGPEHMRLFGIEHGFKFPYMYDETQACAKAYKAECTPDFMLFDENLKCFYRGRYDEASPGNKKPITGSDLKSACDLLLANKQAPTNQQPSMGCNIKWK